MKYIDNKIFYEVGDWVTVTGIRHWSSNLNYSSPMDITFPYTFTIKKIAKAFEHIAMTCGKFGWDLSSLIRNNFIHPATQEEIDKALKEDKIMVGEHEVKFNNLSEDAIYVGCQRVPKETFLKVGKKAGWI